MPGVFKADIMKKEGMDDRDHGSTRFPDVSFQRRSELGRKRNWMFMNLIKTLDLHKKSFVRRAIAILVQWIRAFLDHAQ